MDSCRLSPKTDSEEKIKAIVLIGQYYKEKLHLIRNEPSLVEQMKRIERMKPWSSYQTGAPSWTVYDWVSSKCQRRNGLYEDVFFPFNNGSARTNLPGTTLLKSTDKGAGSEGSGTKKLQN